MIDELDMGDAIDEWLVPRRVKAVTKAKDGDFRTQRAVQGRDQDVFIQPARPEQLQAEQVSWSQRYIMGHSPEPVGMGELVEYQGDDFLIMHIGPWGDFGYTYFEAEATNKPLVQEDE